MDRAPASLRTAAEPLWPVLLVPVLGVALAACGTVLAAAGPGRPPADQHPAVLVGLAAAVLGCSVVAAWTATAALALVAVLAGHHRWERVGRLCGRCSPALLRRAAATVLGLQLIAAPGAVADDAPSPFWSGGPAAHGAPVPAADRPECPSGPATPAAPGSTVPPAAVPPAAVPPTPESPAVRPPCSAPAGRTVDGAVTVLRGDTLWSLAAARLGPGASEEQIARAWPAWYELNRHVLVDGPHLLLPGQRLLVPGTGDG